MELAIKILIIAILLTTYVFQVIKVEINVLYNNTEGNKVYTYRYEVLVDLIPYVWIVKSVVNVVRNYNKLK